MLNTCRAGVRFAKYELLSFLEPSRTNIHAADPKYTKHEWRYSRNDYFVIAQLLCWTSLESKTFE